MKTFVAALAGSLIATAALAQTPPTPPQPPGGAEPAPAPPFAGGPPGDAGPRGGMGPRGMGRGMMMPSKAARFFFRRGESRIFVKCADDEPMRACVEAATQLLDKITALSR